jgi:hypothetical protein
MNAVAVDTLQQVRVLAPAHGLQSVSTLVNAASPLAEPFSAARRHTLAQLSRQVLQDPVLRADAASVALGYWLRRANIDRLAADFERRQALTAEAVLVPAGRVFHVAPGNVDTVFVYSWALAYLCGNASIVRVSTSQSPVLARLLGVLATLMSEDAELAAANCFLTYEHDQAISEALSLWATHRIVWGGDATVALLRSLPLSPHASERTFASKFSFCVMSIAAYLEADEPAAARLAGGFFNDVFWFDQMACSSPHLVVWVGAQERLAQALDRFDAALAAEVGRRGFRGAASNAIHRLNYAFDLACETQLSADLRQPEFLAVRMAGSALVRREVCGAGLFVHGCAANLQAVAEFATERDQTVSQFGFSDLQLREFARLAGARGVDRIVPVGEALMFDPLWDGYDLLGDFVRRVTVRA